MHKLANDSAWLNPTGMLILELLWSAYKQLEWTCQLPNQTAPSFQIADLSDLGQKL